MKSKRKKDEKIILLKDNLNLSDIYDHLPSEFSTYFQYVKSLKFKEKPKYGFLKKLFRTLFINSKYTFDYKFD